MKQISIFISDMNNEEKILKKCKDIKFIGLCVYFVITNTKKNTAAVNYMYYRAQSYA